MNSWVLPLLHFRIRDLFLARQAITCQYVFEVLNQLTNVIRPADVVITCVDAPIWSIQR
jgi:hypothetical protein